jgi:hypothetical protein
MGGQVEQTTSAPGESDSDDVPGEVRPAAGDTVTFEDASVAF